VLAASDYPDGAGDWRQLGQGTRLGDQDACPCSGQSASAAEEAVLVESVEAADEGVEIGIGLRIGEEEPGLPVGVKQRRGAGLCR